MRKLLLILGVICLIGFITRDRKIYNADEIIEAKSVLESWEGNYVYTTDEDGYPNWDGVYTFKEALYDYGIYHENEIRKLSELEELSDIIVEIEVKSTKEVNLYRFLESEITKVYKNNTPLSVGEIVQIVEGKNFYFAEGDTFNLSSPMVPIERDRKYVVFLNPIEGYNTKHFSFTSITFSRFLRQEEPCVKTITLEQARISRELMEDCQVLYVQNPDGDEYYQEYPDYYLKIHKEVIEKYK